MDGSFFVIDEGLKQKFGQNGYLPGLAREMRKQRAKEWPSRYASAPTSKGIIR
jgi:hypothetical protein